MLVGRFCRRSCVSLLGAPVSAEMRVCVFERLVEFSKEGFDFLYARVVGSRIGIRGRPGAEPLLGGSQAAYFCFAQALDVRRGSSRVLDRLDGAECQALLPLQELS